MIIEQGKHELRVDIENRMLYLHQEGATKWDEPDCIEIDVNAAKQLIKVLQEYVDENQD